MESAFAETVHVWLQDVLPHLPHVAVAFAPLASFLQPWSPLQQRSIASQEEKAVLMVANAINVSVIFLMIFLILDTFEAKLYSGV